MIKQLLIKLFIAASLVSGLFLLDAKLYPTFYNPLFPRSMESIGSKDDPMARMNYEKKRLMDPATGELPIGYRMSELEYAKYLSSEVHALGKSSSALTWTSRGPHHVGGRTRALALDVTNENIIIAGSVSGGMWRSTDAGANWTKTTSSYPGATAVVQDKRAGKTSEWYYSSGEPYGTSASGSYAFYLGNGIYKSTDGGITWNALPSTISTTPQSFDLPYELIWNIALNPKNLLNTEIYVAALSGIYKSNDGGTSFNPVLGNFSSWSYFTDVAVTDSGVAYASLSSDGPSKGIWRTSDGSTWANITPPYYTDSVNRIKIGYSPSNQNDVYFLAVNPDSGQISTDYQGRPERNSFWKYTYVSGDGTGAGGTWTNLTENLPHNLGQFGNFNAQGGYNLVVKVKPDEPNVVFIGGTNIYRSTSGFTDSLNTTQIGGYGINTAYPDFDPYPNHHSDQHDILFLPSNPDVLINAADGGIYKTMDCMSSNVVWTQLNTGYITSQIYTLAVDKGTPGSNLLIAGAQDNGSWWENSASPTNTWTFSAKGDGSYCYIQDGGGMYYYSRQLGEMIKCTLNSTGNITAFARIDPADATGYDFINPYTLDPNNNNIMYLPAGTKMWRNSDLAGIPLTNQYDSITTNWTSFPDTVLTQITCVAVSKTPANRVYYGTSVRKVYRVDNANVGSPTRVEITGTTSPHIFPGSGFVSSIAVDPNNGDNVLVVFSNYNVQSLFYSKDAGTTWKKVGGNLEVSSLTGAPSCRYASILPVNNGVVYLVATSIGLYGTTFLDTTNTLWVPLAENEIGNTVCDYIETRVSDGLVVVATHGNGIYSTYITDKEQVGIEGLHFKKERLKVSSYPNPFQNSTRIEFSLEKNTSASLKIYDSRGKEVAVLHNGTLTEGEHTFNFEGKGMSNGIYYCVLKSEGILETKKILKLK